jgi:hypothetical protein
MSAEPPFENLVRYRADDLPEPTQVELDEIGAIRDEDIDFSDIPPVPFDGSDREISPRDVRARFRLLLQRLGALTTPNAGTAINGGLSSFRSLLKEFSRLWIRVAGRERIEAAHDHDAFASILTAYRAAWERHRRDQEERADDFNLLRVLQLTGNEIRHSMVLAWLLDHDMQRLGTHAQGDLGFRLFLEAFKLPANYAEANYWVRREVAGEDSIVDIEIACRGCFLIHVENKIWASEGADQTNREWDDLQRRADALGVPADARHALFLTPRGTAPCNKEFKCISWAAVARVLDQFAEFAKPADVKLFARHYARGLRRFFATQNITENTDVNGTDE